MYSVFIGGFMLKEKLITEELEIVLNGDLYYVTVYGMELNGVLSITRFDAYRDDATLVSGGTDWLDKAVLHAVYDFVADSDTITEVAI